jgi:3-deoxy-D-manno-octulosonic-acid transferase
MFLLYDLIFVIFMLGYLPVFLVKLKQADDRLGLLKDRFSLYRGEFIEKMRGRKVIWIHAVSVGETLAMRPFFEMLREKFPSYTFVLSTVTPTGNTVARRIAHGRAEVIYFPVDISFITRRVVRLIKPKIVILMETELWPNLILAARKQGCKVAIVNARVSPKSFRSYYKIQWLLRAVFRSVDLFLAQNERYGKRLRRLGAAPGAVAVSGNMKFDSVQTESIAAVDIADLRQKYRLEKGYTYIVGASTHAGEERFLLDVFHGLRLVRENIRLVIVPRHIERVSDIAQEVLFAQCSFRAADTDALSPELKTKVASEPGDVFILNTIGELPMMYAVSDIVFMGGSLIKHGGQNPLEAIGQKKPVLSGPHVHNFPGIYDELQEMKAARIITTVEECRAAIEAILNDPDSVAAAASSACRWLTSRKGASRLSVRSIETLLLEA